MRQRQGVGLRHPEVAVDVDDSRPARVSDRDSGALAGHGRVFVAGEQGHIGRFAMTTRVLLELSAALCLKAARSLPMG
jgi:hypothetical protein